MSTTKQSTIEGILAIPHLLTTLTEAAVMIIRSWGLASTMGLVVAIAILLVVLKHDLLTMIIIIG